jgi:hypothetical protein
LGGKGAAVIVFSCGGAFSKRSAAARYQKLAKSGRVNPLSPRAGFPRACSGGPSDFITRQMQPELAKQLGQQVLVDNVGGVGGALGGQAQAGRPAPGRPPGENDDDPARPQGLAGRHGR